MYFKLKTFIQSRQNFSSDMAIKLYFLRPSKKIWTTEKIWQRNAWMRALKLCRIGPMHCRLSTLYHTTMHAIISNKLLLLCNMLQEKISPTINLYLFSIKSGRNHVWVTINWPHHNYTFSGFVSFEGVLTSSGSWVKSGDAPRQQPRTIQNRPPSSNFRPLSPSAADQTGNLQLF